MVVYRKYYSRKARDGVQLEINYGIGGRGRLPGQTSLLFR